MNRKTGKELLESLGNPKYIVAPMVDQSELNWRTLSRHHGAELCYSPMLNAKIFANNPNYRNNFFQTNNEDKKFLIIQFCANDPSILLQAANLVKNDCIAIDLNLGCPQNIAKRGNYGSFLMEDWDLIKSMVEILHKELEIPVTCKIRVYDDLDKTIAYAKMLRDAGCQILTVHGRTRDQRGHNTGLADWEKIKAIKEALGKDFPVFANGNILYFEDIERCISQTGVDGVMVAEANLCNPAIFKPNQYPPHYEIAKEYLDICTESPKGASISMIRAHLFRIFKPSLNNNVDLRADLACAKTMEQYYSLTEKFKLRFEKQVLESKIDFSAVNADPETGIKDFPEWACHSYVRPDYLKHASMKKETEVVGKGGIIEESDGITKSGKRKFSSEEGDQTLTKKQREIGENVVKYAPPSRGYSDPKTHQRPFHHRQFDCLPCSYSFKTEIELTRHAKTHKKCSICPFVASNKVLKSHILSHSTPKPFLTTESPEDIQKYLNARKRQYPTDDNVAAKSDQVLELDSSQNNKKPKVSIKNVKESSQSSSLAVKKNFKQSLKSKHNSDSHLKHENSILKMVLKNDIEKERNIVLQVVRNLIATDFLTKSTTLPIVEPAVLNNLIDSNLPIDDDIESIDSDEEEIQ